MIELAVFCVVLSLKLFFYLFLDIHQDWVLYIVTKTCLSLSLSLSVFIFYKPNLWFLKVYETRANKRSNNTIEISKNPIKTNLFIKVHHYTIAYTKTRDLQTLWKPDHSAHKHSEKRSTKDHSFNWRAFCSTYSMFNQTLDQRQGF